VPKKSIYTREQETLQNLLRTLRQKAGLRQGDLAKKLGRPQSFVSKYESGERLLDVIELRSVCKALKLSLADFAGKLDAALRR